MPFAVASFLRVLLIGLAQAVVIQALLPLLDPLLDKAKRAVMDAFDLDEEDALTQIANWVIDTLAVAGIVGASVKTKIPVRLAERLGFTSKGYQKRPLSSKATAGKAPPSTPTITKGLTTAAEAVEAATQTAVSRGLTFSRVNEVVTFLLKIASFPFVVIFTLAQVIDFGNWNSGAYQKTWQRILKVATFGLLEPDPKLPKSGVLSDEVWNRVFAVYRELGAVGINDPYKNQSVLFSRENLISLVDAVAAQILADGGSASVKSVLAATTALIVYEGGRPREGTAVAESALPSPQPVKVFTGVVTQGTLGAAVAFAARPSDLISSVEELRDAAQNNLASFIAALPGRIVYELKIVLSVTTRDGFVQRGSAQQVVVGYTTQGQPRYKTVLNRFAVVNVYALTAKGGRAKLDTVTLGPTDSVKLQPKSADLALVETSIKQDLFTSDIGEISRVQTAQPITVVPPEPQPPALATQGLVAAPPAVAAATAPVVAPAASLRAMSSETKARLRALAVQNGTQFAFIFPDGTVIPAGINPGQAATLDMREVNPFTTTRPLPQEFFAERDRQLIMPERPPTAPVVAPIPPTGAPTPAVAPAGCSAQTLWEWYTALGASLPPVSERAKLYAALSLGVEAYYTGTAEQNVKLLTELKRRAGCRV